VVSPNGLNMSALGSFATAGVGSGLRRWQDHLGSVGRLSLGRWQGKLVPTAGVGRTESLQSGGSEIEANGNMIIVRYADDLVVGFEHEADARRFWDAMRTRFEQFGLELHGEKTRLLGVRSSCGGT
jgi:Reverse transcriptase (RNA-dependent DNA polymerase)